MRTLPISLLCLYVCACSDSRPPVPRAPVEEPARSLPAPEHGEDTPPQPVRPDGEPSTEELAQSLTDDAKRDEVADKLVQQGAEAIPAIVEALRKNRENGAQRLHVQASTMLARMGPSAAPRIAQLVHDADPKIRLVGAMALSEMKVATPTVIAALHHAKRDPDKKVRYMAEMALRELEEAK